MVSKVKLFILGFFAMFVLISLQVSARDLAKASSISKKFEVFEEKNDISGVKNGKSTCARDKSGNLDCFLIPWKPWLPGAGGGTPPEMPAPGGGYEEPSEPEAPGEPGKPVGPGEPEGPQEPDKPEEPEGPVQPGEPEGPQEPDKPGEPEGPIGPGEPEGPIGPGEPGEVTRPSEPSGPGEPGGHEGSGEHDKPGEPSGRSGNHAELGRLNTGGLKPGMPLGGHGGSYSPRGLVQNHYYGDRT